MCSVLGPFNQMKTGIRMERKIEKKKKKNQITDEEMNKE